MTNSEKVKMIIDEIKSIYPNKMVLNATQMTRIIGISLRTFSRIIDGVVKGLVYSYIIYRSSNIGNILEGFSYNINDVAWDYLHKNYYLLEGNTNLYRTDKRNLI